RGDIPSLEAARPDAPPALIAICKQALGGKADDRFATAAEMRDRLDDYLWSNGGAPQARELAATLMDVFGAARQKQRELIEKYLARLQANPSGESERIETLAVADGTHHGVDSAASRPSRPSNPSNPSHPSTPRPPSAAELPELIEQSMKAARGAEPSRVMDEVPNLLRKHRHIVAAAAAGAVLVGIIIGLGFRRGPQPSADAPVEAAPLAQHASPIAAAGQPSAQPAQPAPTLLPAPALPDMILLSVSVAPPQARVLIDGEQMPSNPFLGRFPKSAATHHVRAVAPGYLAKERLVSFAENVMVDLNLTPKPAAPAPEPPPKRHDSPAARHAAPPPARPVSAAPVPQPAPPAIAQPRPAPPADIQPRAEGPRRRAIDSTNPYGDDK